MSFDAIIVGGGLAGSGVADQLARAGHDVLVLERETRFKDRVRGENMLPWGVAAAKRLGIYDDMIAGGGHPTPTWVLYMMGSAGPPRSLPDTTPATGRRHPIPRGARGSRSRCSTSSISPTRCARRTIGTPRSSATRGSTMSITARCTASWDG